MTSTLTSRKLHRVLQYLLLRLGESRTAQEVMDLSKAGLIVSRLRDQELGWYE